MRAVPCLMLRPSAEPFSRSWPRIAPSLTLQAERALAVLDRARAARLRGDAVGGAPPSAMKSASAATRRPGDSRRRGRLRPSGPAFCASQTSRMRRMPLPRRFGLVLAVARSGPGSRRVRAGPQRLPTVAVSGASGGAAAQGRECRQERKGAGAGYGTPPALQSPVACRCRRPRAGVAAGVGRHEEGDLRVPRRVRSLERVHDPVR